MALMPNWRLGTQDVYQSWRLDAKQVLVDEAPAEISKYI
jgi:hypothetical protein